VALDTAVDSERHELIPAMRQTGELPNNASQ